MSACLISDVQGTKLTAREQEWLSSPYLAGIILFTRNFENKSQIKALIQHIKRINPKLIVSVDHEGGRVQRFREGFTRIPSMGAIASLESSQNAAQSARAAGIVLAAELADIGVDVTYAPVLDLDFEHNEVIGDRSFSSDPLVVENLAKELMAGLKHYGFPVIAKHFPGHGWVSGDSHLELPVDSRSLVELTQLDIQPFANLIDKIDWIMPAHVVYSQLSEMPAGFSSYWLQNILRETLNFKGHIVSDDLTMEGAAATGSYADRAKAALAAGCDILMACNRPEATDSLLEYLQTAALEITDLTKYKLSQNMTPLVKDNEYQKAKACLQQHRLI